MKFKLVNSDYTNLDRYQEVLDHYGVKVTNTNRESWFGGIEKEYEIDITSIKNFMSFIKDIGQPIIIFNDEDGKTLEIYDNWRE